jgi:hypothetical protein
MTSKHFVKLAVNFESRSRIRKRRESGVPPGSMSGPEEHDESAIWGNRQFIGTFYGPVSLPR